MLQHMAVSWQEWISSSVQELSERKLLRTLRPLAPTRSPVKVRPHRRTRSFSDQACPSKIRPSRRTLRTTRACQTLYAVLLSCYNSRWNKIVTRERVLLRPGADRAGDPIGMARRRADAVRFVGLIPRLPRSGADAVQRE